MRVVLVLCLLCVAVGGCRRQSLFDEKLPRHQFEDYDTGRDGLAPAQEANEFGELQPNLRRRLGGS
jgi:hypothetical protein